MMYYDLGIDLLKMYYCIDFNVNDYITIRQPTVGEIISIGEDKIFNAILPFTKTPGTHKVMLWDAGIDWTKLTEYEFFLMCYKDINDEDLRFVFPSFSFSSLSIFKDQEDNIFLGNNDGDVIIDEFSYTRMSEYIRIMFGQQRPKEKIVKGKTAKELMIYDERMRMETQAKKHADGQDKSFLLPLISSMCNHPGFKYKRSELNQVGIYEFMDAVQRLQLYESTCALMSGIYSGMIDTQKMDLKTELNWLRDIRDK